MWKKIFLFHLFLSHMVFRHATFLWTQQCYNVTYNTLWHLFFNQCKKSNLLQFTKTPPFCGCTISTLLNQLKGHADLLLVTHHMIQICRSDFIKHELWNAVKLARTCISRLPHSHMYELRSVEWVNGNV